MNVKEDAPKDYDESELAKEETVIKPPCKRQRTRSSTCTMVMVKNDTVKDDTGCEKKCMQYVADEKSEVMRNCSERSERMLRRVCKQKQPCTRRSTPCGTVMVKLETLKTPKEPQVDKIDKVQKEKDTDCIVQTKNRRQWEQWSDDDVECFFQGLAEHGKDFVNIQLHMKKKKRSKHDDDTKNSNQIRDYYNRTWLKVSKSLSLDQESNKKKALRRELHYMLCLGKLRKRGMMGLGQKAITQLHELVTKGLTYVRHKGKNCKVRPPNRHLMKLYRDENSVQDVMLPKHVNLEFLPNSNTAFNYVQMHAFNPRMRFVNVNINSKFSEVFNLFNKRFTDLCPEGGDLTLFPVLSSDIDSVRFAEVISNAKDTLESCEKKQETPIILEDSRLLTTEKEQLDSSSEYTGEEFPKVFGQSEATKESKKTFIGYWTQSIADEIHLRTLFIALGKIIPMKFTYEWKKTKESPSFGTDSVKFLREYCILEKSSFSSLKQESEDLNSRIMFPKNKEVENNVITDMYCPAVQTICVPVSNSKFSLPLRPRPGRQRGKRNILKSQMRIPNNRVVSNISNSSVQLNNAVAVNIIPQLEQFTQQLVQPSTKKGDPVAGVKSPLSVVNVFPQPVNGVLPVQNGVREEVIDEGDNNVHYKALTSILASSALNQNIAGKDIKGYHLMLKTPTKKNGICDSTGPGSPNLEWLNNAESLDVTLSSFLNVNEMQALQERLKTEKPQTPVAGLNGEVAGNFQMLLNDVGSIEGLKVNAGNRIADPKLPVFHSGDTSQEPFSVSFDLSNQGEFKAKDEYV